jgi:hypothetical protein
MSLAFSNGRNAAGGSSDNGNPKAGLFVGDGLAKWITSSVTSLRNTFSGAVEMNTDVGSWDVAKVTTLYGTFNFAMEFVGAGLEKWKTGLVTDLLRTFTDARTMNANLLWDVSKVSVMFETFQNAVAFTGGGLETWITASLTNLRSTFWYSSAINSNLGSWDVTKITTMEKAFRGAASFKGDGLEKWITSSVTSLSHTFNGAAAMNANFAGWDMSRVKNMDFTFRGTANFEGRGIDQWKTGAVTSLSDTFSGNGKMNTDLGSWDVTEVTDLMFTFANAATFVGTGVSKWNVAKVTTMTSAFNSASALTSCNKRKIADAWSVISSVFLATTYDTDWAADTCSFAALTDVAFKQASWDWVQDTTTATTKWGTIAGWDVSAVKDMSHAFSVHRNAGGGSYVDNGNPKATSFVGKDLNTWKTGSVTNMRETFAIASSLNADFTSWDVANVTTMIRTFENASNFVGDGLETWNVAKVITGGMSDTFFGAASLASCNKRKIADAWATTSAVFGATDYDREWAADKCASAAALTDVTFKEASWDWVQDTSTATTKWGALGDWDVGAVKDMRACFSKDRSKRGGHESIAGWNAKVATFTGAGLDKWLTSSLTSLYDAFKGATSMNADLSGWNLSKTTTLYCTFYKAAAFKGAGLHTWKTGSVTNMVQTFIGASLMDADVTGWDVSKVGSLSYTFSNAVKFEGVGLQTWKMGSVTDMTGTFSGASSMNANFTGWIVEKVTALASTFFNAAKFEGDGLNQWNIAKVTTWPKFQTFDFATSLTSCNKRKIADAWAIISTAFNATSYPTDWAADTCPPPLSPPNTTTTSTATQLTPDAVQIYFGNGTAPALTAALSLGKNATPEDRSAAVESLVDFEINTGVLLAAPVVDRQAAVELLLAGLLSATSNASEITIRTASDAAKVLSKIARAATALKTVMTANATQQTMQAVSSAIDARGLETPKAAIRSIPDTIDTIMDLQPQDKVTRVRATHVAVFSKPQAVLGTRFSAFTHDDRVASDAQGATRGTTGATRSGLDEPIELRAVGTSIDGAPPGVPPLGTFRASLVQYSSSRNPLLPSSSNMSSDVVSLTLAPLPALLSGGTTRRILSIDGSPTGNVDQVGSMLTLNVTFTVTSNHLRELHAEDVTYNTTDACGGNKTHVAKLLRPTRGDSSSSSSQAGWCASWSSKEQGWRSEDCTVLNVATFTDNAAEVASYTCQCIVTHNTSTKSYLPYQGHFGIVDYTLSRVAQTFDVTTPLKPSLTAVAMLVIPLVVYLVLLQLNAGKNSCTAKQIETDPDNGTTWTAAKEVSKAHKVVRYIFVRLLHTPHRTLHPLT